MQKIVTAAALGMPSEATKFYVEEAKKVAYGHKLKQMQEAALRESEKFWG